MFKKLIEKLRRKPKKIELQPVKELEPHEKAQLGQGNWGRVKSEPLVTISARVIRKNGVIEDKGVIGRNR